MAGHKNTNITPSSPWSCHALKPLWRASSSAHLVVLSPSGHPWSWVRWSGCSLGSGGGPPSSHWSPAPGAQIAWGARPSDCESILKSLVQSTSPGPPGAQSPSQTRRLPHAERRVNGITIRERCERSPTEVRGCLLTQHFYDCLSNIFIGRTQNITNSGCLHKHMIKLKPVREQSKQQIFITPRDLQVQCGCQRTRFYFSSGCNRKFSLAYCKCNSCLICISDKLIKPVCLAWTIT